MSPGSGGKFLIDASNLHTGGGVQVGASVLNEVAAISSAGDLDPRLCGGLTALVSTEVAANLEPGTWDAGMDVRVADSRPGNWARFPDRRYRAAFTIFGPYYRRRVAAREVSGFALGLLLYPRAEVGLTAPSLRERVLNEVRWLRFRAPDVVVTETDDSASRLARHLTGTTIEVVPNCVARVISERASWKSGAPLDRLPKAALNLACVGRDYPHKNLNLLPGLALALESETRSPVRFSVTLSDTEWNQRDPAFHRVTVNMGVLDQRDLGPLYEACAATLSPSVLEIASATPLESMSLSRPTFVSDLPSMRSAYGDAVRYFDPWDAQRAAVMIAPHLTPDGLAALAEAGRVWAASQPDPRVRAERFLAIMLGDAAPLRP